MSRTIRNPYAKERSLRRPKTKQELTAIAKAQEDGVLIRAKRNRRRLPDSYDDIPVAANWEIVGRKQEKGPNYY